MVFIFNPNPAQVLQYLKYVAYFVFSKCLNVSIAIAFLFAIQAIQAVQRFGISMRCFVLKENKVLQRPVLLFWQ